MRHAALSWSAASTASAWRTSCRRPAHARRILRALCFQGGLDGDRLRARAREIGREMGIAPRAQRPPIAGGDGRLVSFHAPSRQPGRGLHRGVRGRRGSAPRPGRAAGFHRRREVAPRHSGSGSSGEGRGRQDATRHWPRSRAWSARWCWREPWTMRNSRRTSSRPCGIQSLPRKPLRGMLTGSQRRE